MYKVDEAAVVAVAEVAVMRISTKSVVVVEGVAVDVAVTACPLASILKTNILIAVTTVMISSSSNSVVTIGVAEAVVVAVAETTTKEGPAGLPTVKTEINSENTSSKSDTIERRTTRTLPNYSPIRTVLRSRQLRKNFTRAPNKCTAGRLITR